MYIYVIIKKYVEYFTFAIVNVFTQKQKAIDCAEKIKLEDDEEIQILKIKPNCEEIYPYENIVYKRVI